MIREPTPADSVVALRTRLRLAIDVTLVGPAPGYGDNNPILDGFTVEDLGP